MKKYLVTIACFISINSLHSMDNVSYKNSQEQSNQLLGTTQQIINPELETLISNRTYTKKEIELAKECLTQISETNTLNTNFRDKEAEIFLHEIDMRDGWEKRMDILTKLLTFKQRVPVTIINIIRSTTAWTKFITGGFAISLLTYLTLNESDNKKYVELSFIFTVIIAAIHTLQKTLERGQKRLIRKKFSEILNDFENDTITSYKNANGGTL